MNKHNLLILFVITQIFTGCATITVPASDTYAINSICEPGKELDKKTSMTRIVKVEYPKSTAAINSRHILYQEKEFAKNAYAHSNWSDTPNKMLGALILSCVDNNNIFKAALPSGSKGRADYLLEATILEFYHHVNNSESSESRVRISFYLIESNSRNVIATKEFNSKVSAITHNAKGGVKALNDASKSIVLKLTRWLTSIM